MTSLVLASGSAAIQFHRPDWIAAVPSAPRDDGLLQATMAIYFTYIAMASRRNCAALSLRE